MPDVDRIGAALRADHRRAPHEGGDRGGVQRGGHRQDHQVGSQGAAHLEGQREPQIDIQRAFVEFIEDHEADARQFGIRLQHPRQDTLGHNLDPGGIRHLRRTAHPVADGPARCLAQGVGHPFGAGAGGKAARLEHQDLAGHDACLEQCQRHARRLASAGRRLENRVTRVAQGGDQGGQAGLDGQGGI